MAKETVNSSGLKNPRSFNEQVNNILLIMFLTVVAVVSVKGCGKCDAYSKVKDCEEDCFVKNDSLIQEAIVYTY